MKIFDFLKKNRDREVIEALKEQDTKRRNEEITAIKKLNTKINLITKKGDVEIIIRNVDGIIRELK